MSVWRCYIHHPVIKSILIYVASLLWSSITDRKAKQLDKLVKMTGSVIGVSLKPPGTVLEWLMINKQLVIRDNANHPLYHILVEQSSSHSGWLIYMWCGPRSTGGSSLQQPSACITTQSMAEAPEVVVCAATDSSHVHCGQDWGSFNAWLLLSLLGICCLSVW